MIEEVATPTSQKSRQQEENSAHTSFKHLEDLMNLMSNTHTIKIIRSQRTTKDENTTEAAICRKYQHTSGVIEHRTSEAGVAYQKVLASLPKSMRRNECQGRV
jgi:hypothetical protein